MNSATDLCLRVSLQESLLAMNKINRSEKRDFADPIFVKTLQEITRYLLERGYAISDLYDYMDDIEQELKYLN